MWIRPNVWVLRPVNGLGWCCRKTNRISHDLVFTKRFPVVLSRFIARERCPGDAGSPRSSGVPPRRSTTTFGTPPDRVSVPEESRKPPSESWYYCCYCLRFASNLAPDRGARKANATGNLFFVSCGTLPPFPTLSTASPPFIARFIGYAVPHFFTSPLSRYFLLSTRACDISADASACGASKCTVDGQHRSVHVS